MITIWKVYPRLQRSWENENIYCTVYFQFQVKLLDVLVFFFFDLVFLWPCFHNCLGNVYIYIYAIPVFWFYIIWIFYQFMLVASDSLVLSFLWLYKFTGVPWGHVEYCVIAYETVMFSVLSIKPHMWVVVIIWKCTRKPRGPFTNRK